MIIKTNSFEHINLEKVNQVPYNTWSPELLNAHLLVVGTVGSGKTLSIKDITFTGVLHGVKTVVFSSSIGEYNQIAKQDKTNCIELNKENRINPYDLHAHSFNEKLSLQSKVSQIQELIFLLVKEVNPSLLPTNNQILTLRGTIKKLYENFGITGEPLSLFEAKSGTITKKQMPTLFDHYLLIKEHEELEEIARAIKLYTREGTNSFLDTQTTIDFTYESQLTVIYVTDHPDYYPIRHIIALTSLYYIYETIGKSDSQTRKRFVLDDVFTDQHAELLHPLFRESRKYNISLCLALQSVKSLGRTIDGMGILKNISTMLLFRQCAESTKVLYDMDILTELEAHSLLSAPAGRGYLKAEKTVNPFLMSMSSSSNQNNKIENNNEDLSSIIESLHTIVEQQDQSNKSLNLLLNKLKKFI